MGRAYQELGHLNRDSGNEEKAINIIDRHASLILLY